MSRRHVLQKSRESINSRADVRRLSQEMRSVGKEGMSEHSVFMTGDFLLVLSPWLLCFVLMFLFVTSRRLVALFLLVDVDLGRRCGRFLKLGTRR